MPLPPEAKSLLPKGVPVLEQVPLRPYTTMQVGGPARYLVPVTDVEMLADVAACLHESGIPHSIIGSGSNLLVADSGVDAVVVVNQCNRIRMGVEAEAQCGCWLQDLFLAAAQSGLAGLEFAVGIPGTLGGALVSNAGAYRSSIANLLTAVDVVWGGIRKIVAPHELGFRYRDSVLRHRNPPLIVLLKATLQLEPGDPHRIYNLARDYQRQRISKQPPHPSVGSFFKNVVDRQVAERIEGLRPDLREAGVVPAGYLIEACGMKGLRKGNAFISRLHANFICNLGEAKAADVHWLAQEAKRRVLEEFGVELEPEVLYLGDWSEAA